MHIYFLGIGGAGIGPLAQVAHQAGYRVSGSDQQASAYIDYLKKQGLGDIHIGQSAAAIAEIHQKSPIDWFVYSSALTIEDSDAPELAYCRAHGIKTSKRDELLNQIIQDKGLQLLAVAGTHGKTTTTAMVIWLFRELGLPVSYSVGAKLSFGSMGEYVDGSEYFVYEADEFDRNFLAFEPALSLITGVSWDHHEIFPTREDYQAAFRDFIGQSRQAFMWQEDAAYLGLARGLELVSAFTILDSSDPETAQLYLLAGKYNRMDAWLAAQAVQRVTGEPFDKLLEIVNRFPGLSRRMEPLAPSLYSDYAHTPEKIRGALSVATEMAADNNQRLVASNHPDAPVDQTQPANPTGPGDCESGTSTDPTNPASQTDQKTDAQPGQKVIVIYEPLTNRRQHYMLDDYGDCFVGADHVYWLPSYLAREDPAQPVLTPAELIAHLADPTIASPMKSNAELKTIIQKHLDAGDLVVAMAGGGGGSLDDWLRAEFTA